jgi:hypothetical protein
LKHYLITPWNVDNLNMDWLLERKRLFEKFCLPSVLSQTNTNFEWLLMADARTPDEFRVVLDAYPATVLYVNFDLTNINKATTKQKRGIRIEESIRAPLTEYLKGVTEDYIITTRLDSDDAISTDHIDKIQRYAKQMKASGLPFWLNLQRGLKWCGGNVYPIGALHNPFVSMVETPEDPLTAYRCCHKVIYKHARVEQVREGHPTWMQVIHGGNLLNKLMRYRGEKPFNAVRNDFKIDGKE